MEKACSQPNQQVVNHSPRVTPHLLDNQLVLVRYAPAKQIKWQLSVSLARTAAVYLNTFQRSRNPSSNAIHLLTRISARGKRVQEHRTWSAVNSQRGGRRAVQDQNTQNMNSLIHAGYFSFGGALVVLSMSICAAGLLSSGRLRDSMPTKRLLNSTRKQHIKRHRHLSINCISKHNTPQHVVPVRASTVCRITACC